MKQKSEFFTCKFNRAPSLAFDLHTGNRNEIRFATFKIIGIRIQYVLPITCIIACLAVYRTDKRFIISVNRGQYGNHKC